jgi:hypothetical protein
MHPSAPLPQRARGVQLQNYIILVYFPKKSFEKSWNRARKLGIPKLSYKIAKNLKIPFKLPKSPQNPKTFP